MSMEFESLYKASIYSLLDRFHATVLNLNTSIDKKNTLLIRTTSLLTTLYLNIFQEILPDEIAAQTLGYISQHIWFVEYYYDQKDYSNMKGNADDLLTRDIPRLKKEIQKIFTTKPTQKSSAPIKMTYEDLQNDIMNKLRSGIYSLPGKEKIIQDALETYFVIKDIKYEREAGSVSYSTTKFIPDFIMPDFNCAVEIKLCKSEKEEKLIINQINADILAYHKKYENSLFIVYDLGIIKNVKRFTDGFEEAHENVSVMVVKH